MANSYFLHTQRRESERFDRDHHRDSHSKRDRDLDDNADRRDSYRERGRSADLGHHQSGSRRSASPPPIRRAFSDFPSPRDDDYRARSRDRNGPTKRPYAPDRRTSRGDPSEPKSNKTSPDHPERNVSSPGNQYATKPPTPISDNGRPNNSSDREVRHLIELISDRSHWFSIRYVAAKKTQKMKEDIKRFGAARSGYASQHELLNAQIKDSTSTELKATERISMADKLLLEQLPKLLEAYGLASPAPQRMSVARAGPASTFDESVQASSDFEKRLAALEKGRNEDAAKMAEAQAKLGEAAKIVEAQLGRIKLLEAQIGISTARDGQQDSKIAQLEKSLTHMRERLKLVGEETTQNKEDVMRLKSAPSAPASLAGAEEIIDLQFITKKQERDFKQVQMDIRQLKTQGGEVDGWKDKLEKKVSAGLKATAIKDDLQKTLDESSASKAKVEMRIGKLEVIVGKMEEKVEGAVAASGTENPDMVHRLQELQLAIQQMDGKVEKTVSGPVSDLTDWTKGLLPRIEDLESSTLKNNGLEDFKPEDLRAILKRDISSEISEEVKRQARKTSPPREPSAAARSLTPTIDTEAVVREVLKRARTSFPSTPSSAIDMEAVAEQVKSQMQLRFLGLSKGIGELLDNERLERLAQNERIDFVAAGLESNSAQMTELGTTVNVTVEDIRNLSERYTEAKDLIEYYNLPDVCLKVSRLADQGVEHNNSIISLSAEASAKAEAFSIVHSNMSKMQSQVVEVQNRSRNPSPDSVAGINFQLGALQKLVNDNYTEVVHQISTLNNWQSTFRTKDIYRDIVAQIQENLPNGTLARLNDNEIRVSGAELRLEAVERAVKGHNVSQSPQLQHQQHRRQSSSQHYQQTNGYAVQANGHAA